MLLTQGLLQLPLQPVAGLLPWEEVEPCEGLAFFLPVSVHVGEEGHARSSPIIGSILAEGLHVGIGDPLDVFSIGERLPKLANGFPEMPGQIEEELQV